MAEPSVQGKRRPRPSRTRKPPGHAPDPRVTVVVITHNRRDELLRTLDRLGRLPEAPAVAVVDNASRDGTADAVRSACPEVALTVLGRNLGAVGRNIAARSVTTPYIAFCDDDVWWAPGALARAADLLDAHPEVATVTGRVIVEPDGTEDPIVPELRNSPVPPPPGRPLPGPVLGSILAGASMVRADAFRAVGGFSPRLVLGGEEELLSADLLAHGYALLYANDVEVHHQASPLRDPSARRRAGIRNTLWSTWLRRPLPRAVRRTLDLARTVPRDRVSLAAFADAARGMPGVLRARRVLPRHAEQALRTLDARQLHGPARRYVG
ncbi:glycosyltransferase family 2 protein [Yinghuangia sp. YIM S10712]|uniref:glycosyltransferase family 2 protein n=1 Tax=Yinghuangia sp. YIM S10712 TaxID=3436930 RepID=UPI003F536F94